MREPFAHEATLEMGDDADLNALGAAVTQALCGHWDHEAPCPLAPHYSHAHRLDDGAVRLRVIFATEPDMESDIRQRITAALTEGELRGASGAARWRVQGSSSSCVRRAERDHAERLAHS